MVLTPFLLAKVISSRPNTDPAAVCMIHSPLGAAISSTRQYAVTGLICRHTANNQGNQAHQAMKVIVLVRLS